MNRKAQKAGTGQEREETAAQMKECPKEKTKLRLVQGAVGGNSVGKTGGKRMHWIARTMKEKGSRKGQYYRKCSSAHPEAYEKYTETP